MIGLIQRVKSASVHIDSKTIASIRFGLLLMIGFVKGDREENIERFVDKIVSYRIFNDSKGRMNESVIDKKGGLLVVPQFTLGSTTNKGNRPSFSDTMEPEHAKVLYDRFVEISRQKIVLSSGVFGAHMEVQSINDGPATFILVS